MDPVRILLVSGSLREGSTNSALVRTAAAVAPEDRSLRLCGLAGLPYFNPDDDAEGVQVPAAVAALRAHWAKRRRPLLGPRVRGRAAGLVQEPARVDGRRLGDLPAARCLDQRRPEGRGLDAEESLGKVLGLRRRRRRTGACVRLTVDRNAIRDDGTVGDPSYRERVAEILEVLGHTCVSAAPTRSGSGRRTRLASIG